MSKVVTYKNNTSGSGTRETVTTKYVYDGAGNRVNAKVELNGSVTSNTTYVVDGESSYNDIIMAKDSVSGKTSIFTFSDEVISVETSGNISYYRNDEKHSVTDILDTAGKVKATIEYDEYGVIANPKVVSTGGNIFAYTGHVYEESTGLYYAKARYYDAEHGRFVSEDSYRGEQDNPASLNLFIYGLNNSIKYTDPSGNMNYFTQTDDFLKGIVSGVGAWIKDIIQSPKALIKTIKQLISGELSVNKLIKAGLEGMIEDVVYIAKHKSVFNPFKKVSNSEVKEIGKHTGKLIADVASAIIAGKLVSSFSKSKVGQKIIKKLKMKKGKKTKAPSTSTPKPNNTRINVANGRTRYTPKRANGNYVSAGMEHIISGHFNRALGNSRLIFSISIDKLKKILQRKDIISAPIYEMGGGQYRRIVNTGMVIGNTALKYGGKKTKWIEIITDVRGNIITAYPVPKP